MVCKFHMTVEVGLIGCRIWAAWPCEPGRREPGCASREPGSSDAEILAASPQPGPRCFFSSLDTSLGAAYATNQTNDKVARAWLCGYDLQPNTAVAYREPGWPIRRQQIRDY